MGNLFCQEEEVVEEAALLKAKKPSLEEMDESTFPSYESCSSKGTIISKQYLLVLSLFAAPQMIVTIIFVSSA